MSYLTPEGPLVTSRRGFFWVGTDRAGLPSGTVAQGPMYVAWEAPEHPRHPYPVVLIHGGGGQGTDWLGTPDGRPGWATFLVQEGHVVYVVDRPGHGRSPFHPDVLGPMTPPMSYQACERLFHPDARHTQWPGHADGQFLAGSGPMLADTAAAHAREQARGAELLGLIGPAIVVSHSAGGPMGWLTADARPDLVRALVAIEPLGPPFLAGPPGLSLPWGLTAVPLTTDPPAAGPDLLQAGPARRLAALSQVPIALVAAGASPAAAHAPATREFLARGGCQVELIRLADHGLPGNGHGMMLERNNREVLGVILDWLGRLPAS